jgi:hypothetical protein
MRWSHLHGDMQGTASQGVPFHLDMSKEDDKRNSLSGNRVARCGSDPADSPANNGEAFLVCDATKDVVTRDGNPVGSRLCADRVELDPVTTDRPCLAWT